MAFTIASSTGTAMVAPPGMSNQGRVFWAVNQGAYWVPYLTSTQSLSFLYSTNSGVSWSAPTGSPYSLTKAHGSQGRNFGFCYLNKASTDILYMCSSYYSPGQLQLREPVYPRDDSIEHQCGIVGNLRRIEQHQQFAGR